MIGAIASACCFFTLFTQPKDSGWRTLQFDATLDTLSQTRPAPQSGQIESVMAFMEAAKIKPKTLLAVDLFWAFSFYPLASHANRVDRIFTSEHDDAAKTALLAKSVSRSEYVLWGKPDTTQAKKFEKPLGSCLIFKNSGYNLFRVRDQCRASLMQVN